MRRQIHGRMILIPIPLLLLLLLLSGALAGQWVGEKLRLMDGRQQMALYMDALLSYADRLVGSARDTLDQAERSPYATCSVEERDYLRKILFSAYQIKDIGRRLDERQQCSTLLSEMQDALDRSAADVALPDKTYVYGYRLRQNATHGPVIHRGNSHVVLSSVAFDLMHTPGYKFTVFITDPARQKFARLYEYPVGANMPPPSGEERHEFIRPDMELRSYICKPGTMICVATSTIVDNSSVGARLHSFAYVLLGTLIAAGIGFCWLFYSRRDRSLMSLLAKAVNAKKLDLVYQPVVDILKGDIVGFEALIRWEITKGEFVPPDAFIPRAENSGLIQKITLFVIDRVIEEMGEVLRAKPGLRININISARDLHDLEFMKKMEARLADASIDPRQIGLELTERTAVDFVKASAAIARLRSHGHRIFIDDFGTGYSSLAYLDELKVDAIKIDKAFTRTIGLNEETVSIVPQIVAMARQHRLDIVVEGVETEAQAAYFRNEGLAVEAQGWYFGKPISASTACALVLTKA